MPRLLPPASGRFQKGESGNPNGRPKARLTKKKLSNVVDRLAFMSKAEILDHAQNPETPMVEVIVASILFQAAVTGDPTRLSMLLDRTVGKVPGAPKPPPLAVAKAPDDISGPPAQVIITLPSNGRETKKEEPGE